MSSPSSSFGKASDFEAVSKAAVASAGVQVTTYTELVDEVTLHFQIIRLAKQIYVWIGSDSAKLGNLYAATPTRPNNTVSVTSILGGASDNTGSGIARRLVLKTGLSIIVACNIPKNNPMLEESMGMYPRSQHYLLGSYVFSGMAQLVIEHSYCFSSQANAEKKLIEKLVTLGYLKPKSQSPGTELSSS